MVQVQLQITVQFMKYNIWNPFCNKGTLTHAVDFIIYMVFNLLTFFSVPEKFPNARVWLSAFLTCPSIFHANSLVSKGLKWEMLFTGTVGGMVMVFSQQGSQQVFEETSSLGYFALLCWAQPVTKCLSDMVRILEAAGEVVESLFDRAADCSLLSDCVSSDWEGMLWYLGLVHSVLFRPALGPACLLYWSFFSRVKPHLFHLPHSGCWCRRLLPSFPGYGAEPTGWQHWLIAIWRFTARDVHHSCLHCLHHGQAHPEHCQTGEGEGGTGR